MIHASDLTDLAVRVADGLAIDWANVESDVTDHSDRRLLQRLRIVEQIAQVHASPSPGDASSLQGSLLHPFSSQSDQGSDIPITWGPLTIVEKIGRGTFGDVYRAREPKLDRPVALKLLRRRERNAEAVEQAVIEEGRLMARVRHPNVVTIHGAERIDGRVGLWMELIEGRTLEEELRQTGPFAAAEVVRIGIDLCHALEAVHGAGLLHRDLKAQNVMRTANGRVLLTDFGAGRELAQDNERMGHELAGTPLYLAPEVLAGSPATPASDAYSLGVLLYHLATGSFPVHGRTLRELREAHTSGARSPVRDVRPDLPSALAAVIDRALHQDPGERYQRAADLEQALRAAAIPGRRIWVVAGALAGAALIVAAVNPVALSQWAALWERGDSRTVRRTAEVAGAWSPQEISSRSCPRPPSLDGRWRTCAQDSALVRFDTATERKEILHQIPGGLRIDTTFASPDGKQIAYATGPRNNPPNEVHLFDVTTRTDRLVATVPSGLVYMQLRGWHAGDWLLEFFIWRADGSRALGLMDPRVGALEIAFEFPGIPQGHARSPDGRLVAFDHVPDGGTVARDVYVCELKAGRCAVVAAHPAHDFNPSWLPDGRLLFNSDRLTTNGLWVTAMNGIHGSTPELVADLGRRYLTVIGVSGGGTVYFSQVRPDFDVYSAELRSVGAAEPAVVRLSRQFVGLNKAPVWSPDGKSVAYIAQRSPFQDPGAIKLVIQTLADQTEREIPIAAAFPSARLAWSPEGNLIALRASLGDRRAGGGMGVHLIDVATGRLSSSRHANAEDVGFLNSRTLVFHTRTGVRGLDLLTGDEHAVWNAPPGTTVLSLAVSSDGASTAVLVRSGPGRRSGDADKPRVSLMVLNVQDGAAHQLMNRPDGVLSGIAWLPAGDALLVTAAEESRTRARHSRVWRVPVNGAPPEPLQLMVAGLYELSVHPDGDRVAFSALVEEPVEYGVVELN